MAALIVQSSEIITLLGAAPVDKALLSESLGLSGMLVAADGGAKQALEIGHMPFAVIGDLDSLTEDDRARIAPERIHHIAEQDSTDFDKALRHISAPAILAEGFTGGRLDHELAVYNAMIRHVDRKVIVLGREDICIHLSMPLTLMLPVGTRLSLFPMAEVACSSTGLRWPTDGLKFAPDGFVGTSNETVEEKVHIEPSGPGMLLILPRGFLRALIQALIA